MRFRGPVQYILDEFKHPVRCLDPLQFAVWAYADGAEDRRRVGWTDFVDGSYLSTVFIGVPMGRHDAAQPLLFESAHFFKGPPDRDVKIVNRYSTWADAELGHVDYAETYARQVDP